MRRAQRGGPLFTLPGKFFTRKVTVRQQAMFVFAAESQRRILRLYNAARASRRRDRRRDSRATSSDRCTQQHLRYSRQEGFEPGQQQQAVQTRQPGEQEYSCHGSRSLSTLAQRQRERASDHASSEFERGRHGL